jgi:integrase/recombinase XerD
MRTAAELIDAFCDQVWLQDGLAAASLASYRRDLISWSAWLERHAHKSLLAAERTDVEAFLAAQFQSKAKIASINRRLSTLRRFYRLHAAQATIAADPTLRVKSPKLPRSLPRNLSEDQVAALLGAPDTETPLGLRDRAMLETLYASGLRVSELV